MNLTKRIVTASLAVATTLGVLPATSAQAATSVRISYRDHDHRDYRHRGDYRDYRRDYRRSWDRRDNRRGRGWNSGYRYRDSRRCWTEWRYDRWRHERVRVRYCR